jgi:exodeoxyribonuclease VII small subunit
MNASQDDNRTFEQSLADLERVVRDLEDGQLGLEDALARYETGVGLLKRCYAQLQQAEQRILLLAGVDSSGAPITESFEHAATAETKTDNRARRKKIDEPEVLF